MPMRGVISMFLARKPSSPIHKPEAGEVRSQPLSRARVMPKASARRPGPLVRRIKIARSAHFDVSCPCHFLDAAQRFDCAEQHASRLAFALARHIQTVMIAVDEINVGVAGRSEQDCSAGGVAGGGVGRGIVFSEVSFDFDDAGGEKLRVALAHQHLAEKFASHAPRTAGEE